MLYRSLRLKVCKRYLEHKTKQSSGTITSYNASFPSPPPLSILLCWKVRALATWKARRGGKCRHCMDAVYVLSQQITVQQYLVVMFFHQALQYRTVHYSSVISECIPLQSYHSASLASLFSPATVHHSSGIPQCITQSSVISQCIPLQSYHSVSLFSHITVHYSSVISQCIPPQSYHSAFLFSHITVHSSSVIRQCIPLLSYNSTSQCKNC